MADYRSAIQAGLDAYNDAERARREITEVFEEFAKGVQDASKGHIGIQRSKRTTPFATAQAIKRTFGPSVSLVEEPLVLVAAGRDKQDSEILCEYSLGERGYPVKLIYGRRNVSCHDRESLEQELQELLAHPETGGKLGRLMSGDHTTESGATPPQ